MMSFRAVCCSLVCVVATSNCSDDATVVVDAAPDAPPVDPAFPANYAATYQQVRDCRKSGDHDLNFIRVLAAPDGLGPYMDRVTPFADGAILIKEEFDIGDSTCSDAIVQWTVMVKDAAATELNGWRWQRVNTEREVVESDTSRCFGCHEACDGVAPNIGYDYTCTEP